MRTPKIALDSFLEALTNLSSKHGLAIGGAPIVFVMEDLDHEFSYSIDDESNLSRT